MSESDNNNIFGFSLDDYLETSTNFETAGDLDNWLGSALMCAKISRIAYLDEEDGRVALKGLGFDDCEILFEAKNDTEFYLVKHRLFTVVAFRGTKSAKDLISDVKVVKHLLASPKGGRVHRGFNDALDQVWPKLEPSLRAHYQATSATPLFLTGHSLGGALALLTANRIVNSGSNEEYTKTPTSVFTYGAPRIGNARLTAKLNSCESFKLFRIVFASDIVPKVPYAWLGYRHIGRKFWMRLSSEREGWPLLCRRIADWWLPLETDLLLEKKPLLSKWFRAHSYSAGDIAWGGINTIMSLLILIVLFHLFPSIKLSLDKLNIFYIFMILIAGVVCVQLCISWLSRHLPDSLVRLIYYRRFSDHGSQEYAAQLLKRVKKGSK